MIQTNEQRKIALRDQQIFEDYERLKSYTAISKLYGLSYARARDIVLRMNREKRYYSVHKDEARLRDIIFSLPLKTGSATNLYNLLRRSGIKSPEALREQKSANLLRITNMGPRYVGVLLENDLICDDKTT